MTHFRRQVGFQWIFIGVLLLGVLLPVGFLGLRWAALSAAQAQAQDKDRESEVQKRLYQKAVQEAERALKGVGDLVAPLAQKHFLEKGKSYSFSWQDTIGPAVVLEEPRDNWVKVRWHDSDVWINLTTVHCIMAAPQAGEKKDAGKGALEGKGTIKGIVTLNGKPVPKGKVTFHPEKGNPVEADLDENGSFMAKGVPAGSFGVTVKAEGVPAKYADKDKTEIQFQVSRGENVMNLDLKK
jgi:hypothetical protein